MLQHFINLGNEGSGDFLKGFGLLQLVTQLLVAAFFLAQFLCNEDACQNCHLQGIRHCNGKPRFLQTLLKIPNDCLKVFWVLIGLETELGSQQIDLHKVLCHQILENVQLGMVFFLVPIFLMFFFPMAMVLVVFFLMARVLMNRVIVTRVIVLPTQFRTLFC